MVEGAIGVRARRVELAAFLAFDDWLVCVCDWNANRAEHWKNGKTDY